VTRGSWTAAVLYPLSLFILPFVILWRNSNLIFSGLGYVDPWVYYGFFRNLVLFKRDLFPGTYYGSRLAWILPGYLVNQLFDPLTANYVLHLGVYYTALFSLYYILARTINRPTALLTAIVFGLHPFVWMATGGDYPDGASIAYYLLTTVLLTYAAERPSGRWLLALAGASYAALVYCNIAWLMFTPIFPVYYLLRRKEHAAASYLRELGRFCLWAGAGAVMLTLLFGIVNYRLDHHFWFYGPSVDFVTKTSNQANPYKATGMRWIWDAKWLLLPALTLLALPFTWTRWRRSTSGETRAVLFFAGAFLFNAAVFVLAEVRGNPMIEFPYYASLLLPSAFLALGAAIFRLQERWDRSSLAILIGATAVLALPWWDVDGRFWTMAGRLGASTIAILAVAALLWRSIQPRSSVALGIFLLALAAWGAVVPWTNRDFMRSRAWHTGSEARDGFLRIADALHTIEADKPDRATRFWIDVQERDGKELASLSSVYLFGYKLIGTNFPTLPANVQLTPGSLVVLPSDRANALELAQKALEPRHMIPALVSSQTIERGDIKYYLDILRLERDPQTLEPLTLGPGAELKPAVSTSAQSLPDEKWLFGGVDGTMKRTAAGVAVTTPKGSGGYSAYYNAPLAAPVDGTYLFTLRFQLLDGRIAFGALKEDKSVWLAQVAEPERLGNDWIAECTLPLKAGQRIWVQTFNNAPEREQASSFLIEELKAYRLR
jgi:hypothetical protein